MMPRDYITEWREQAPWIRECPKKCRTPSYAIYSFDPHRDLPRLGEDKHFCHKPKRINQGSVQTPTLTVIERSQEGIGKMLKEEIKLAGKRC